MGLVDQEPVHRLTTGRLCLELVSTVRGRLDQVPRDDLVDSQGLSAWLSRIGISTSEPPTGRDVDAFRAVREAIYRLVVAVTGDGDGDDRIDADVTLINRYARRELPASQLRPVRAADGRRAFEADTPPLAAGQALALFARDTVDLLTGPAVERLHQCEASTCGTFYVDASRGAQRRWCLSTTCGNRARVGAFRTRMSRATQATSSLS